MIIKVEGIKIEIEDQLPKEGELYVAERNVGKQLLTALKVDLKNRWIIPEESAYVYDLHECKRVIKMIEK